MKPANSLLQKLLRALIEEWGYEAVSNAVSHLSEPHHGLVPRTPTTSHSTEKKRVMLLATDQVARATLNEGQMEPLKELASRFDRKEFLPSTSDVREFLIMMGERPTDIKSRSAAFRQVLKTLSRFSPDKLQHIASSARHSGPSRLRPLSEAISSAAASLARNRTSHD